MNTDRFHRSMKSAFGPDTSDELYGIPDEPKWYDHPVALCAASLAAVLLCWALVAVVFA